MRRRPMLIGCALLAGHSPAPGHAQPVRIRIATFNLHDVRTTDLTDPSTPRIRALAETIQRIRPTIILLNEIAYDLPGASGVGQSAESGRNGRRFCELFLAPPQATDTRALPMTAFMAPVNTGMPSGFDLDNDGVIVTSFPAPSAAPDDASDAGREYGNDCWGFGTFPGQYGMALLVDPRCKILTEEVRTFRLLPWSYMPGGDMPRTEDGVPWYAPDEEALFRLSSKSHWDVPVRLPNGTVLHVLCSHPTPPAFDGPEQRNRRRNAAEIRFWADYIAGEAYIVDDSGRAGGLDPGAPFVILGDLNADPERGDARKDPIDRFLFSNRRIPNLSPPAADPLPEDPAALHDTARWGLRVDYVLPSSDMKVLNSGVWRHPPSTALGDFPSDHFPVWADIEVPAPR